MKQPLLFFFCIIFALVNAQNNSSFARLEATYKSLVYEDATEALRYAEQAKNVALRNADHLQLTKAYYYIANCNYHMSIHAEALQHIDLALQHSSNVTDTVLLYKCVLTKGNILSQLGKDSEALMAYVNALKYAEQLNNAMYEIPVLTNIASIKKLHKDFEEAIDLYKTLLKKLDVLKDTQAHRVSRAIALMNLADTYLWLQQPNEASYYNEQGLALSSNLKMEWLHQPLLMNTAIIHYQKKQYNDCITLATQVAEMTMHDEKKGLYLTALFYLGKSSSQLKNYEAAIAHLQKVWQHIDSSETVDINEKELHEFLAVLYNKVGNSEKNLFHFKKYTALEKKQSAEDLKINNETHELVDMVSLRNEINEVKDDLAEQRKNKKTILIASIVLLVLLTGSIVYYKRREKYTKEQFDKLLLQVAQLEQQETEIETTPKKEKVTDAKAAVILEKIADFEKKESFTNTECSLGFMANQLGTNTSYLSKVINTYKGKSFTAYITELRIHTALIRLKNDTVLQSYTVQAIAEEFGFKRQETFSKAFKAHTGIYPSQYLKKLRENESTTS